VIEAPQILCVGDIHLGRRPRRLPDNLADWGHNLSDFTPVSAWRATVDYAVAQKVNAVLLAGDVVQSDNQYYEAFGPLDQGVRKLVDHGISVYAVAGNHDVEVLPRLADDIDGFHLLGPDGTWEETVLEHEGKPFLRLAGWSFPTKHVTTNPLIGLQVSFPDTLPVVGLVHCDLDVHNSQYAPVASGDLKRTGYSAWLLGHIHTPSTFAQEKPVGYLGSLVGLDPTETGLHGPWLMTVSDTELTMAQVATSPLRWEHIVLPVDAVGEPGELDALLSGALADLHGRLTGTLGDARAVGVRITLTGRSSSCRALEAHLRDSDPTPLRRELGGVLYFVDKVQSRMLPALDLQAIARQDDPPGLLARKLLRLETPEGDPLVQEAMDAMQQETQRSRWQPLGAEPITPEMVKDQLRNSGIYALQELLAQQEPAP